MQKITHVRRNRKHWALSQDELAQLLGLTQSQTSRIESGESEPDLNVALGLQVIFGRSPRALFTTLYRRAEETVMRAAADMDLEIAGMTDRHSRRKQQLLKSMSERSGSSTDGL